MFKLFFRAHGGDLCFLDEISRRVTIGILPDEILLKIFDFCRQVITSKSCSRWPKVWHNLVHVCQRWRYVIFSSPLLLDLRVYYSGKTPVRTMLDVWPHLPIEVSCYGLQDSDNIVSALEQHDRICKIHFTVSGEGCGRLPTVMHKPFPALTCLRLEWSNIWSVLEPQPALPITFLGGSAPSLQSLTLRGVPFPTLPQFLLSCNDLSELRLEEIPKRGYISPETMVTVLSALTKLTYLEISFENLGAIRLAPPPPPPLTRAVLPVLTVFKFQDANEYSENLLARIAVPRLESLSITYEYEPRVFDIRQVIIHSLPLGPFLFAEVTFSTHEVDIRLYQSEGADFFSETLNFCFLQEPGYETPSMGQICTLSPLLSSVIELNIRSDWSFFEYDSDSDSEDLSFEDMSIHSECLVLFRPFTAVRTLRLRDIVYPLILCSLLGHTGESVTEVLPELRHLYPPSYRRGSAEEKAIELFITGRQHSGHTVTVHRLPYRDW
jgi:F-box-like